MGVGLIIHPYVWLMIRGSPATCSEEEVDSYLTREDTRVTNQQADRSIFERLYIHNQTC